MDQHYDVFLSYAHLDGSQAQDLDAWLRGQTLRTFFDRNELKAGLRWVPALEDAIGRSDAVAILVGPHGLGNTQQYERELALVRQTRDAGFPVIPVLLPGCARAPTGFLELVTWIDLRGGVSVRDQPGGLQSLLAAIRRQPVASAEIRGAVCPYMGLEPFQEEDAAFFCGRDGAVQDLVARVNADNFVAVVGRSGSGKSSLVFAGLMPALRRQRVTTAWDVATVRPGAWPLHALAAAFNPTPPSAGTFAGQDWLETEVAALRAGPPTKLVSALAKRLANAPEKPDRLLLYIDQWEELYTLGPGREALEDQHKQHAADVERFIALLVATTKDPAARTSLVLTVRADFYGPLIRHPLLSALLPQQQVNIGPMSRDDLRSAIVVPAQKVGLDFHPPGLVDQILDEVGSDEGMLPLLQYALKETWVRREGKCLTADGYVEAGRVQGAIRATAERTYAALKPAEKEAARRLFLGLVRPGEGNRDTKIRIALPSDETLREVAAKFADPKARLLVMGSEPLPSAMPDRKAEAASIDRPGERPTLELAHEALIRTWPALQDWLDLNREKLEARAAILQQKEEWDQNGENESLLLPSGFHLERGLRLLADPGEVPVEDIRAYIERSAKREEERRAAERARLVEEERRRADEQERIATLEAARAATVRRWFVGAAATAVVAIMAAGVAFWQYTVARDNGARAAANLDFASKSVSSLVAVLPEMIQPSTVVTAQKKLNTVLDPLVGDGDADPARQRLRAAALLARASLWQLIPAEKRLTDAEEARQLLEGLSQRAPKDQETRFLLAKSLHMAGFAHAEMAERDHYREARREYEAAAGTLQVSLKDEMPADERTRCLDELYDIEIHFGDLLLFKLADGDSAAKAFDAASQISDDLSAQDPANPEFTYDVAWAINKHADIFRAYGDYDKAREVYVKAEQKLQAMGDKLWNNRLWPKTLALVTMNIGRELSRAKKYDESIDRFKKAADVFQRISMIQPNDFDIKSDLGWSEDSLGETLFRWARGLDDPTLLSKALEALGQAHATRAEITQHHADNEQWRGDLRYTEATIAAVRALQSRRAGNQFEAARLFDEATNLNRRVSPPDDDKVLRTIEFLLAAASSYSAVGSTNDARERLLQAVHTAEERSCSNPKSPSLRCRSKPRQDGEAVVAKDPFADLLTLAKSRLESLH